MRKWLVMGLTLLALASPVSAQNILERINNGLKKTNAALAGSGSTAQHGPAMPTPSQAQVEQLAKLVVSPVISADAKPLWDSARDRIGEVLLFESCYPEFGSYKYLAKYAAPGAEPALAFHSPIFRMTYHPKTECVSVERIDDVKLLAKNAFSFRVVFVSDASGETQTNRHSLVRQPDGAWLFRAW